MIKMELTFDNPLYLWFLLSIPLMILSHFILLKRAKRRAIKFANFHALKRIAGERLITKNLSQLFLRIAALACLILAAAGTTLWYTGSSNENDFVIAIDSSASMAAQDFMPSRLEAAKESASTFIDDLKSSGKIGLVTFSGITFINSPLADSKSKIKNEISKVSIMESGGTDIPGAIVTGANLLESSQRGKAMILLTDGSSTKGTFISDSVQQAIDYAKSKHVTVYTIGIGSKSGPIGYLPEYYNVSATFDEDTLKSISNQTGGEYFYAANSLALKNAYNEINQMSSQSNLDVKLGGGLLLIALILLFVEWGLANTRFRRIP